MEYVLIAFYIFAILVFNTGTAVLIDGILELAFRDKYKQKYRRYLLIPGVPFIALFVGIPIALFLFVRMITLDFFQD
jgi:hypothetical protein